MRNSCENINISFTIYIPSFVESSHELSRNFNYEMNEGEHVETTLAPLKKVKRFKIILK